MTGDLLVFLGAALASAVEMVEALTIVLALGVTRGWRAPLQGAAVALAFLVVLVAVLGPALAAVPIDALRLVVGSLLLVFGLQWLRKAILRASGYKALHDEEAAFAAEVSAARAEGRTPDGVDRYAFVISFKSTLLEGLEVAFIIVTFGGAQKNVGLAALGAAAALIVVTIAGVIAHAPLSRVPENTLKFGVGIMLTSFGIFWSAEGAGVSWPGGDASLLGVLAFVIVLSFGLVAVLRNAVAGAEVAAA